MLLHIGQQFDCTEQEIVPRVQLGAACGECLFDGWRQRSETVVCGTVDG
ncbi:hypothetical protein [uncultured Agathobaculum sp.]